MNQTYLMRHWYADIYEQQVTQQSEVDFILSTVGNAPQRILEVACGGGRISVPLARAGHHVIGFDSDEHMLFKALAKGKGQSNLAFYQADAVHDAWGEGFDAVILAGNLLINIESDLEYICAQKLFLQKAAACVRRGGRMYLDFDCFLRADQAMPKTKREWVCFEGLDDLGTYGKYIVIDGEYDSGTCVGTGFRRYEIEPEYGAAFQVERTITKHFPRMELIDGWLSEIGWRVEALHGGYEKQPFDESKAGNRAILWAVKP